MSFLLASNSANGQPPMTTVRPSLVGPGREAPVGADVGLEAAVHRQPAPVGVVAGQELRLLVVLLGPDRAGDQRVPAVRPDDHPGALGDRAAAPAVAADAGDVPVLDQDLLDGEPLPDLRPRLGRGVDQQLVQHGPPGGVGDRALVGAGRPGDGEGAEVDRVGVDRRAPGRRDQVEQPPPAQRRHARRVDDVGRERVAREGRPVDDQDLVALAGQQHRGRRPGAACADHDRVVPVPVGAHARPLLLGQMSEHHGRRATEHRGGPLSRG